MMTMMMLRMSTQSKAQEHAIDMGESLPSVDNK